MNSDIVIIGAGHSGGMLAIKLRRKKYKGSILIIGNEPYHPYQKPPLSKGFLTDDINERSLMLKSEVFYKKNNINLLLSKNVVSIDSSKQSLALDDGKTIYFSKLIFATGGIPNKLHTNSNTNGILYLRTIEDSKKIKDQMNRSKSLLIIGAGYIGLEISAIARKIGIETTVIEMSERPMSRVVCPEVSDFFKNKHETNGVNFLLDSKVVDVQQNGGKKKVFLKDGSELDTDMVIVGIGLKPNEVLAKKAGIKCNNGITVDTFGETSIKNIFAIGDCSNQYNDIFKKRLRLESVQNAVDQAEAVASVLTGGDCPKPAIPWFWSDQYDLKLQITGISSNYDSYKIEGSLKKEKFSVAYHKSNKLIALEAINDSKSFLAAKRLLDNQIEF